MSILQFHQFDLRSESFNNFVSIIIATLADITVLITKLFLNILKHHNGSYYINLCDLLEFIQHIIMANAKFTQTLLLHTKLPHDHVKIELIFP